jgi:Ca2+-binding RTX toxin-like protein
MAEFIFYTNPKTSYYNYSGTYTVTDTYRTSTEIGITFRIPTGEYVEYVYEGRNFDQTNISMTTITGISVYVNDKITLKIDNLNVNGEQFSADTLFDHDDHIILTNANETFYGGFGEDTIKGNVGHDILMGGDGNDYVMGDDGNDTLYGGSVFNFFSTNDGNDTLIGGRGSDTLYAGSGNDTLYGGASVDKLYGGRGKDTLYGDKGNDFLYAGDYGRTLMTGGSGTDVFIFHPEGSSHYAGDQDHILDFTKEDHIDLSNLSKINTRSDISIQWNIKENGYIVQDASKTGQDDLYIVVHSDHRLTTSDFIF